MTTLKFVLDCLKEDGSVVANLYLPKKWASFMQISNLIFFSFSIVSIIEQTQDSRNHVEIKYVDCYQFIVMTVTHSKPNL